MDSSPSTNGDNGRDNRGRFAPGNRAGRGNPYARQAARLRAALLKAITAKDVETVVSSLIKEAKAGDVQAIREVLDRAVGKPLPADLLERLERLEALADGRPIDCEEGDNDA